MKILTLIAFLFFVIQMSGCGSTGKAPPDKLSANIYKDELFPSKHTVETEQEIFYVSKPMRSYIRQRLSDKLNATSQSKRLLQDLFDPNQLNIRYAHNANLTAAEVFEQGVANCLSLTLLSYVLVEQTDMDAVFVDVSLQENWTVENGISLANGHVNLKVFRSVNNNEFNFINRVVTIDFLPMLNVPVLSQRALSKQEIMALFYNNKGANALINGERDIAYAYFKQATMHGPALAETWGNLASLYRQSGELELAELLFKHGIELDPSNLTIKENLARLYELTDRSGAASTLNNEVKRKRKNNPYFYAMQAALDYNDGNYRKSVRKYKKAIKMHDKEHQFLFGLAKSYLKLNEYDRANYFLKKAHNMANSEQDKELYRSKMSALQRLTAKIM